MSKLLDNNNDGDLNLRVKEIEVVTLPFKLLQAPCDSSHVVKHVTGKSKHGIKPLSAIIYVQFLNGLFYFSPQAYLKEERHADGTSRLIKGLPVSDDNEAIYHLEQFFSQNKEIMNKLRPFVVYTEVEGRRRQNLNIGDLVFDSTMFGRVLNECSNDYQQMLNYWNQIVYDHTKTRECIICKNKATSVAKSSGGWLCTNFDIFNVTPDIVNCPTVPRGKDTDVSGSDFRQCWWSEASKHEDPAFSFHMFTEAKLLKKNVDMYFHPVQQYSHPHIHVMGRFVRNVMWQGDQYEMTTFQMYVVGTLIKMIHSIISFNTWEVKTIYENLPLPIASSYHQMGSYKDYLVFWLYILATGMVPCKFGGTVDDIWGLLPNAVAYMKSDVLFLKIAGFIRQNKVPVRKQMLELEKDAMTRRSTEYQMTGLFFESMFCLDFE